MQREIFLEARYIGLIEKQKKRVPKAKSKIDAHFMVRLIDSAMEGRSLRTQYLKTELKLASRLKQDSHEQGFKSCSATQQQKQKRLKVELHFARI